MTQDEIIEMAREAGCIPRRHPEYWEDIQVFATPDVIVKFANLVAAKALAQPEQEPVATVESVATVVSESGSQEITMSWWHEPALPVGTKLYTTPPQRTWVGLTDEEMKQACYEVFSYDPYIIARAIEAKLKEKNT